MKSLVLILSFLTSVALANTNDTKIADCGDFQVVTGGESLSASFADKNIELESKSKEHGVQLFVGNVNSEKDIYIEYTPSEASFKTFTVEEGKKLATRECVSQSND